MDDVEDPVTSQVRRSFTKEYIQMASFCFSLSWFLSPLFVFLLLSPSSGLFFKQFKTNLKPGSNVEANEFATYTDPISQLYHGNSGGGTIKKRRVSRSMPPEEFASYKDRISQMYLLGGGDHPDARTFVRRLTSEGVGDVYKKVKKVSVLTDRGE